MTQVGEDGQHDGADHLPRHLGNHQPHAGVAANGVQGSPRRRLPRRLPGRIQLPQQAQQRRNIPLPGVPKGDLPPNVLPAPAV